MNANASFFGAFGVVLALLMWALVLIGLALTCAVLSPVYADWRRSAPSPPGDEPSSHGEPLH